jgi:quinol---cytochrome c reductase iron-sulfur subunit, bacillus type
MPTLTSVTQTRRTFYSSLIYGLGSILGAALALPAAIYLLVSPRGKQRGNFVEAANLAQLEVGKPQEVAFSRIRVDGWRTFQEKVIAWVVRTDETNVVAYSPQCTHLGCAYHWEDKRNQFVCPCHESLFSIDGKVQGGPAARSLDRYDVLVKNNKLLIGSTITKA